MLDALIESYKIEKGVEFDIVYLDYLGIMKSDLLPPSVGLYSLVSNFMTVVFPDPEGPVSKINSPGFTSKDKSLSA